MRNLAISIALSVLGLCTGGCSHLIETPYSNITTASFFKSQQDADAAVVGIYSTMHHGTWWYTDNAQAVLYPGMYSLARAYTQLITYQIDYSYTPLNSLWTGHYTAINQCNAVLKYVPGVDMDETHRNQLLAEARWLRAYLYFDLVRLFGNVPLRMEPTESENQINLPRTSYKDIYNRLIIPDLEFAEQNLPMTGSNGRIGRGAAPFLLGKVYLTMAGKPMNDASQLTKAKEKLEDVINNQSGYGYALMPRYIDVFPLTADLTGFDGSKELNKELIFVIQQAQTPDIQGSAMAYAYVPLQSLFVNVGTGGSHQLGYMQELYDLYEPGDERRDINLIHDYAWRNNPSVRRVFGKDAPYNNVNWGMCQRKYIDPDQVQATNGDPDIIIYRLADAYLMLAEVDNELTGPADAVFDNLDMIRQRAKASAVNRTIAWTQQMMRDTLYNERIKELNFEFHDVYDLRRLGLVAKSFQMNPQRKAFTYDPKFELYPIPQIETERNPLCTQNQGW